MAFVWVFLGSGLGGVLRYSLHYLLPESYRFFWATLAANLCAAFLAGCISGILSSRALPDAYKWALLTGFCGGLSTFSTFSLELFQTGQSGQIAWAVLQVSIQVVGCLSLTACGWLLARQFGC